MVKTIIKHEKYVIDDHENGLPQHDLILYLIFQYFIFSTFYSILNLLRFLSEMLKKIYLSLKK